MCAPTQLLPDLACLHGGLVHRLEQVVLLRDAVRAQRLHGRTHLIAQRIGVQVRFRESLDDGALAARDEPLCPDTVCILRDWRAVDADGLRRLLVCFDGLAPKTNIM